MHDALRALGLAAGPALVVPLRGRETEAGALWLFEGERSLAEPDLERAALVTAHAEVALHNAERYLQAPRRRSSTT